MITHRADSECWELCFLSPDHNVSLSGLKTTTKVLLEGYTIHNRRAKTESFINSFKPDVPN